MTSDGKTTASQLAVKVEVDREITLQLCWRPLAITVS